MLCVLSLPIYRLCIAYAPIRVYVMVKLSVPACARAELFSENNICIIVPMSYITNVSSYRLTIWLVR